MNERLSSQRKLFSYHQVQEWRISRFRGLWAANTGPCVHRTELLRTELQPRCCLFGMAPAAAWKHFNQPSLLRQSHTARQETPGNFFSFFSSPHMCCCFGFCVSPYLVWRRAAHRRCFSPTWLRRAEAPRLWASSMNPHGSCPGDAPVTATWNKTENTRFIHSASPLLDWFKDLNSGPPGATAKSGPDVMNNGKYFTSTHAKICPNSWLLFLDWAECFVFFLVKCLLVDRWINRGTDESKQQMVGFWKELAMNINSSKDMLDEVFPTCRTSLCLTHAEKM